MANCLKAVSAWRLERGITVLDLEYLLGSRTVFSTFVTPLKLRSVSFLAPMLIALWALSPLGGQAALRVVETLPATTSILSPIFYLEFKSPLSSTETLGSSADATLPAAVGAFNAALSSPRGVKLAGQDAFGNIRVPMLEALESVSAPKDPDGWYDPRDLDNVTSASILGWPFEGRNQQANMTSTMHTSYPYTTCQVAQIQDIKNSDWYRYMQSRGTGPLGATTGNSTKPMMTYSNGRTLMIGVSHLPLHNSTGTTSYDQTPFGLSFLSYTYYGVTNSSCDVTTSYIETRIFCHRSSCTSTHARRSRGEDVTPIPGVFDSNFERRARSTRQLEWFFDSFNKCY